MRLCLGGDGRDVIHVYQARDTRLKRAVKISATEKAGVGDLGPMRI